MARCFRRPRLALAYLNGHIRGPYRTKPKLLQSQMVLATFATRLQAIALLLLCTIGAFRYGQQKIVTAGASKLFKEFFAPFAVFVDSALTVLFYPLFDVHALMIPSS